MPSAYIERLLSRYVALGRIKKDSDGRYITTPEFWDFDDDNVDEYYKIFAILQREGNVDASEEL
jgi:hypothetical protein